MSCQEESTSNSVEGGWRSVPRSGEFIFGVEKQRHTFNLKFKRWQMSYGLGNKTNTRTVTV